jgi:hypothetical protein
LKNDLNTLSSFFIFIISTIIHIRSKIKPHHTSIHPRPVKKIKTQANYSKTHSVKKVKQQSQQKRKIKSKCIRHASIHSHVSACLRQFPILSVSHYEFCEQPKKRPAKRALFAI